MQGRRSLSASLLPPVVLLLFQIGPRLQVVDVHVLGTVVLAVAGGAVIGLRRSLPDWLAYTIIGLLPALTYAIGASGLSALRDLALPWLIVKIYLYALATFTVVELYRRSYRGSWVNRIIRHTLNIWLINAVFLIAFVFIGPFRRFVGQYWDVAGKEHWVESGYRGLDMSLGGGVSAGVAFALVFFMVLMFRRQVGFSAERSALYLSVFSVAAALSARTSLILLLLGGSLLVVVWCSRKLLAPTISVGAAPVRVACIAVGGVAILAWAISSGWVPDHVLRWAFEFVYSDGAGIGLTRSTERIFGEMYLMPPDAVSAIFGTGNLGRSTAAEYLPSDVGYVRVLFAVGVIGSFLFWLPFGLASLYAAHSKASQDYVAFFLMVVLFMFIVNIKELMVAERGLGALALLAWALASRSSGPADPYARA
jgi:hypothetical protein